MPLTLESVESEGEAWRLASGCLGWDDILASEIWGFIVSQYKDLYETTRIQ